MSNDPRLQQPGQPPVAQYGHGQYGQQYPGYPQPGQVGYGQYPQQYNYGSPAPAVGHVPTSAPSTSGNPVVELQWMPPTNDSVIVDRWFKELDKEGRGIVGGLEIAMFLKRSNLPKDSLRTIWSLIDNKSLGYVNKSQFNNIIRLVSISCSPIYMGSPPSLERLQKTLYDKIALPAALLEEPVKEVPVAVSSPAPTPAHPSVAPAVPAVSGYPAYHYPPQPGTMYPVPPQPVYPGHPAPPVQAVDDDAEFSDFSSASHAPVPLASGGGVGMMARAGSSKLDAVLDEFGPLSAASPTSTPAAPTGPQWVPPAADKALIDKWFAELDAENKGAVGGLAIAMFLKKSNLPKDSLRTIWSLVDNKNAGHVNKDQFANIIRLVSISCSPIYMGSAPNMERFEKTLNDNIRLPFALTEETAAAESAKPAAATDAGAVYATVPMQRTPSGVSATPTATILPVVAAPVPVRDVNWVPPPIDAVYLDKWFGELDAENKGTLGGLAVAMFLKKSNLPTEALRAIWSLIDSASLGYINKVQFTNMMRMAAIQCCPAYAAYPPSLERLEQTLHEFIPLPLALVHEQSPLALEPAPVSAAVLPASNQGPMEASSMASPSLPSPVHRETSAGSFTFSPAKSLPGAGVSSEAPAGPAQWIPPPQDASYIDKWFTELDTEGKGTIGGLVCAMFLKRSNLPKEILRTIWALVDSSHMGFVNKAQFTNMVRMVAIHSSPSYTGLLPSLERLQQTLQEFIPLPPPLLIAPQETTHSTATSLPVGAVSANLAPIAGPEQPAFADAVPEPLVPPVPAAPQWVPPAADKALIDKWFLVLDAENKGAVGGLAIAMFLKKSNLPKDSLRTIWSLIDNKNAGHVNKDQFTNIIRLVSISCSPIYMGSAPTMERFEKTLNDEIPLPFALTDPSLSAAPVIVAAPAVHAAPIARAVSVDDGDDDDMGDFSPPVAVQGSDSGSNKGTLEAKTSFTLGQAGSTSVPPSVAPAHRLSVFDDLVESDLKAMDDDWEDFAEGAPTPSTSAKETAAALLTESAALMDVPTAPAAPSMCASNAIDLMDLLGDDVPSPAPAPAPAGFAADFTAPAAKSIDFFDFDVPTPAPALQPAAAASTVEEGEDDDDFGDFDAAPQVTTSTRSEFSAPAQLTESEPPTLSQTQSTPSGATSAMDDFGDAEFADDDFGDFETHSPMPTMSQLESKASLFDMDAPASGNAGGMSYSVSELSLFDAPGDQTDDFMQDAFAGNLSSKPSTQEVDLLDFLSEPAPAAVFPVSKPSAHAHTHSNNVTSFAAFEDPFSAPAKSSVPASQSVSLLDDDFGVPAAPPAAATSSPPALASRDTTALLKRKNLKSKDLDALCATLMKKCLYEQAYNCNEQAKIVRSIENLTAQKTRAVEDDDLETAMILKKDINLLQLKVTAVDQEAVWEEEARSSRAGDSLQETADLLCAVDDVMGAKFKRIFLTSVPATNAPLDTQLQFYITAKRYARMVLAICSTHNMYPKQWLQVLQVAVAKVKEGNEIVARFKRLSTSDRNALTSHLKISEYALGLVAMAEIGMWVSASCTEAMVHEKIAGEVYAVCQDLLSEVDQLWGMGSRFKAMAMDTLTLEAARLAESKNVQYCNFTLRPLSYEVCKRDGDKLKVDTVKLYDNPVLIENSHFMEPVIKLWLHDVAKELPKCAAAVF